MGHTRPRESTQAAALLSGTFFTTVRSLEQGVSGSLLLQYRSRLNPQSPKEIPIHYDPESVPKQKRMVSNNCEIDSL